MCFTCNCQNAAVVYSLHKTSTRNVIIRSSKRKYRFFQNAVLIKSSYASSALLFVLLDVSTLFAKPLRTAGVSKYLRNCAMIFPRRKCFINQSLKILLSICTDLRIFNSCAINIHFNKFIILNQ